MSVSQSNPRTRLANHVRACCFDDQIIFLDLLRSKYIGISGLQITAISAIVFGCVANDEANRVPSDQAKFDECIRNLRNQHLLSDTPFVEPIRRGPRMLRPASSLAEEDESRSTAPQWHDFARLWRATFVAAAWVRWRSLADIAERVEALRARHSKRGVGLATEMMRVEAARYMRLRPFALTTHDRCLNDSLTLIHFLACQGLFPQWVIGVRVRPFRAHSWVQSGSFVLNDLPERVRHYEPILIV